MKVQILDSEEYQARISEFDDFLDENKIKYDAAHVKEWKTEECMVLVVIVPHVKMIPIIQITVSIYAVAMIIHFMLSNMKYLISWQRENERN